MIRILQRNIFRVIFISITISIILNCYPEVERYHFDNYHEFVAHEKDAGNSDWLYRNVYSNATDINVVFSYDGGGLYVTYRYGLKELGNVTNGWVAINNIYSNIYHKEFIAHSTRFSKSLPDHSVMDKIFFKDDYDKQEKFPLNHVLLIDTKKRICFLMYTRIPLPHNNEIQYKPQ